MKPLIVQIFLVLYALIALVTGYIGITAAHDATLNAMTDNSHRFTAAIWAAMALGFMYCVFNPDETTLFRFLMICLFIGGLVRAISLRFYPATPMLIFAIVMELVPPPILWCLHSRS
ncbi:MAG: DUF4345 family protein [Nonlabens sp.]